MSRLNRLYSECGQSPWIDNLRRSWLSDGTLASLIEDGVRGLTSNPTILAKAITEEEDYSSQLGSMTQFSPIEKYWELVISDIAAAADQLRVTYEESLGTDGYVSIEVDPRLAQDYRRTVDSAIELAKRISMPNLMIKIPATRACLPAIADVLSNGISVNVTLIFGLERYRQVIGAFKSGIQRLAATSPEQLSETHSVASIFVSRTDTLVDSLLDGIGAPSYLYGKAAVALSKLAYQLFLDEFDQEDWRELEAMGATVQRPLWASTSTKNPNYNELLYVEELIGPRTVNTMPDHTLAAFRERGRLGHTLTLGVAEAQESLDRIVNYGVDLGAVSLQLEAEGLRNFESSHLELLRRLES